MLEALSAGIPVIATDVGSVGEVISNGEDGIIVPSRDVLSLVMAIEKVLSDKTLAERLAKNGKKKASLFTIKNTIQGYERLYFSYFEGNDGGK